MTWFFNWLTSLFSGSSSINKLVVKIQAATVKLCGFLPMAESVAALVAAGNPQVATAAGIANKICVAVSATKAIKLSLASADGGTPEPPKPIVDGVVIEGEFINPKE